jgi:hypothetical protein
MAKKETMGSNVEHSGKSQLHLTGGSVLTPVLLFRAPGITGTPPKPEARGFTNKPGDGPIPAGKSKTVGGNSALKAFGLQGSGQNEK